MGVEIPLVWCVLVQQGIHFRYWVIKFYVCNLQRFVAKGVLVCLLSQASVCVCVCHCEIVIDNMTGES